MIKPICPKCREEFCGVGKCNNPPCFFVTPREAIKDWWGEKYKNA